MDTLDFLLHIEKIKQLFVWRGMKSARQAFVQSCTVCQQAKSNRAKYPGLLPPLPILEGAWQAISLNFIQGLPRSGHANYILIVVDKFSKYDHVISLSHPFTVVVIAQIFFNYVYKLHGMPITIISDRDKIFTSQFQQELFTLAYAKLQMSSAYHPRQLAKSKGRISV